MTQSPSYEIILRRCIPAKTESMRQLAGPLMEMFASMDRFAQLVQGQDDHAMEFTHAMADIFRGFFVKAYGVDFCPTNDLGPHEEVELGHSLAVLQRLLETTPHLPSDASSIPESVRQDLCRCFLDLERHAYMYREQVRDGQRSSDSDEIFEKLERNLAKIRTNGALWIDGPQSPRPSSHLLA